MNAVNITLDSCGSVYRTDADFKIMQGCYRSVLINVELPRSLLMEQVTGGGNSNGNSVRLGALIDMSDGSTRTTRKYEMHWVKDYTIGGVDYAMYQRIMPKEFTLLQTVGARSGHLEMVINVITWSGVSPTVEEIVASPIVNLEVHRSAFLDNEQIDYSPSDLTLLHSQVQEIDRELDAKVSTDIHDADKRALEGSIEALTETVNINKTEVDKAKADVEMVSNKIENFLNINDKDFDQLSELVDILKNNADGIGKITEQLEKKVDITDYTADKATLESKIVTDTSATLRKAKEYADKLLTGSVSIDEVYYGGNANTKWTKYDRVLYGGNANSVWTKYDRTINGGKANG